MRLKTRCPFHPRQKKTRTRGENPTTNSLTIEYNLQTDEPIKVEFYDLLGSKAMTVTLVKGQTKAMVDVNHLANGTYIYRTLNATEGGKIVILR